MSILNCAQTLIVDLAPGQGSAITACVSSESLPPSTSPFCDTRRISAEQPRQMLPRRSLRLRHTDHSQPITPRVDVRPHHGHLHRVLPRAVRLAPLRARVEGEAAGPAASRRGCPRQAVKDNLTRTWTRSDYSSDTLPTVIPTLLQQSVS